MEPIEVKSWSKPNSPTKQLQRTTPFHNFWTIPEPKHYAWLCPHPSELSPATVGPERRKKTSTNLGQFGPSSFSTPLLEFHKQQCLSELQDLWISNHQEKQKQLQVISFHYANCTLDDVVFFVELSPTHLDEYVAGLQKQYLWHFFWNTLSQGRSHQ